MTDIKEPMETGENNENNIAENQETGKNPKLLFDPEKRLRPGTGSTGSISKKDSKDKTDVSPALVNDNDYVKRARTEITKIGMYCGIRVSFYACILALMACYFAARMQNNRAPMAIYISFFCLVLAPVLNLLRKGADQKEDFVLSALKTKYKYSIEKYMINNLSYFGILMVLAFWLKTTLSTESPVFYIPLIGVITLTAVRILATLIFVFVTRIRLAHGKI